MNLMLINESLSSISSLLIEALINPLSPKEDHSTASWGHYGAKDHHNLAKMHLALSDAAKTPKLARRHASIADYHFRRAKSKRLRHYKPKEHAPVDPASHLASDHRGKNWSKVKGSTHQRIASYHKAMANKTRRTNPSRSKQHTDVANYHTGLANRKQGDWWKYLSKQQQANYLQTHPKSKFHGMATSAPTKKKARSKNIFGTAIKKLGKTLKSFGAKKIGQSQQRLARE